MQTQSDSFDAGTQKTCREKPWQNSGEDYRLTISFRESWIGSFRCLDGIFRTRFLYSETCEARISPRTPSPPANVLFLSAFAPLKCFFAPRPAFTGTPHAKNLQAP